MKKTLDIKSVCECNRRLGCKTLHPQASIINLEHPDLEQEAVKFEFYAVLLIEECTDGCYCCGRKYYDYSNATMVFSLQTVYVLSLPVRFPLRSLSLFIMLHIRMCKNRLPLTRFRIVLKIFILCEKDKYVLKKEQVISLKRCRA